MLKKLSSVIFLLIICGNAFGATQLKKTVCPSGCDYTSLEAAMNANEQNLVTADKYFDVEISGTWSSADTTAVTIHNYTTDATRYINIYTTGDARHDGTAAAVSGLNSYRLIIADAASNSVALGVWSAFTTIDGLEVSIYSSSLSTRNYNGISVSRLSGVVIKNNIVHDVYCATYNALGHGIQHDRGITIYNNVVYNIMSIGIRESASFGQNQIVYNNTVYNYNLRNNSAQGIATGSTNANNLYKNNIVIAGVNGGNCYALGAGVTRATNGASDTTGDIDNLTAANLFISVTAGSEDLHLKTGADAIDSGTDLGASYNTDIIGTSRPQGAAWDIGAFEYVSSTPTAYGSVLNDSVWNDAYFK